MSDYEGDDPENDADIGCGHDGDHLFDDFEEITNDHVTILAVTLDDLYTGSSSKR